jgi:hypothetical protein
MARRLAWRRSRVQAPKPQHSFLSPYLQLFLDLILPGRVTPDQVPLNKHKLSSHIIDSLVMYSFLTLTQRCDPSNILLIQLLCWSKDPVWESFQPIHRYCGVENQGNLKTSFLAIPWHQINLNKHLYIKINDWSKRALWRYSLRDFQIHQLTQETLAILSLAVLATLGYL